MNVTQEVRASERIPVQGRISLMVQGRAVRSAILLNVSLGGLFLNAAIPLPPGNPVEVAIALPEGSSQDQFIAQGRVVRSVAAGTAIQFATALDSQTLAAIVKAGSQATPSFLQAYRDYFKVSQSKTEADCQRVFGVSLHTFKTLSTASFLGSIPAAILPVWLFRSFIPPGSYALKIGLCFLYGALWLLVLQPFFDLAVLQGLRHKADHHGPAHKA